MSDEIARRSIVLHQGKLLWPAPAPPVLAPTPGAAQTPVEVKPEIKALTPWQKASREVATLTGAMGGVVALGKATTPAFMANFYTFGLAGLIGYRAVWGVTPALHSPLMSVTNAISGTSTAIFDHSTDRLSQVWSGLADCSSWAADTCLEQFLNFSVLRL
jgi:NAD(P) transhydrogenase